VEEELTAGVRRVVLRIARRKEPASLVVLGAVEVVDTVAADAAAAASGVRSTNAAAHLELRCFQIRKQTSISYSLLDNLSPFPPHLLVRQRVRYKLATPGIPITIRPGAGVSYRRLPARC